MSAASNTIFNIYLTTATKCKPLLTKQEEK